MDINLYGIGPHQQRAFRLCWMVAVLSGLFIGSGKQTVIGADADSMPTVMSDDEISFPAGFLDESQRIWLHKHAPIRVGVTHIPPQVFKDEQTGELSGLCIDYLRKIETLLGSTFEIVYYDTWKALMDAAFARQIDVIYAAQQTPLRLESFLFTQPYLRFDNKIVMTTEVNRPVKIADLVGKRVAVVEGAATQEHFQSNYPQIRLIPVADELVGLLWVSFGQADAMILEVSRASWYIRQDKITNLHVVGDAEYLYLLGFACRNDQPEIRDILDAALAQIPTAQRQELETKWIFPKMGVKAVDWRIMSGILIGIAVLLATVFLWNISLRRLVRARTFQLQQELAERKKAEALQTESKRKLSTLMDNLQGVVFRCLNQPDWPTEFLSQGCLELTGYPMEEFLSRRTTWNDLIVPEDRMIVWEKIQEALRSRQTYQIEYRIVTCDGRLKWLWEKGCGIFDENGDVVALEGFISDISHRKDIEEKLRNQEAQLASILKASPVGIGLLSDRVFLHVNDRICIMTGYTHEELIGRNSRILYPNQEEYDYVGRKYQQIKEQRGGEIETCWRCKNGKMIDVLLCSSPIDVHNLSKGVTFSALDITEAKQARQMAIAERDKAQQYLDIAGVMIVVLDIEGRIKLLNKKGCEILECTEGQARGKDWFTEFLPESARKKARKAFCDLITGQDKDNIVKYFENSVITTTGKEKLIAWHNTMIRNERGEIIGTLSSGLDVTNQRIAEQALQFTQFAMDHAGEAAFWMEPDAKFIYVNDAACRALKYSKEQLLTMSVQDIDPDFPADIWPQHWQEMKEKRSMRFESHHKTSEGHVFPVEVTANFLEYENREYLSSFVRDITERKRAEEAIRESENKHRLLFTSANDAIFIMDRQNFLDCNPNAVELYGCSRVDQLLNHSPIEFSPEYQEDGQRSEHKAIRYITAAYEGSPQRFPWVHCKLNGEIFYAEVSLTRLELEGCVLLQAMVRDVTERRGNEKAREKLLRELQSKNEELESIVFIASHDLRSPLVNIRGFSGELEKSLTQLQKLLADEKLSVTTQQKLEHLFSDEIPESIGFINAGNRKMDMLLNGLLRLSRVGMAEVSLTDLDMNQMFEGILNNFRFRTRQTDLEITVDKEISACRGDAALINQVFNNLIDNAIKYRSPDRPAKIHISAETTDRTVIYRVQDNGIGIASEHINKVFEIFHRLNPSSDQTGEGLGLTIVRRLLKRQDGQIWIDSEPGVGTSVYVELPKA